MQVGDALQRIVNGRNESVWVAFSSTAEGGARLHSPVYSGEFTGHLWKGTQDTAAVSGGRGECPGDRVGIDSHSLLFGAVGIFKHVNGLLKQNVKVKKMKSGHCQHQTPR